MAARAGLPVLLLATLALTGASPLAYPDLNPSLSEEVNELLATLLEEAPQQREFQVSTC